MPPATPLAVPPLVRWQLRYWAFLTGLLTTGTKHHLLSQLTSHLDDHISTETPNKIVSVDMGIRNLAYCAIEVPPIDYRLRNTGPSKGKSNLSAEEKDVLRQHDPRRGESPEVTGLKRKYLAEAINVKTWKRMDVMQMTEDSSTNQEQDSGPKQNVEAELESIPADAFAPSKLSRTALKVTKEILSHNPTTILIERQRFRSGGAAAIQEWTVRVNMLESMIWACLATLRASNLAPSQFPDVHAISPAQVTNFWNAGPVFVPFDLFQPANDNLGNTLTTIMSGSVRGKVPKKFKIDVVRQWCNGWSDVQLKFDSGPKQIADAFATSTRQTKAVKAQTGGKLDDLADCLMQGVTWVRWERNRRVMADIWEGAVEEANRNKNE